MRANIPSKDTAVNKKHDRGSKTFPFYPKNVLFFCFKFIIDIR